MKIIAIISLLILGGCNQHYYGNPHHRGGNIIIDGRGNDGGGKHGHCPPGHHKKGQC